jgi:hypothetical protein
MGCRFWCTCFLGYVVFSDGIFDTSIRRKRGLSGDSEVRVDSKVVVFQSHSARDRTVLFLQSGSDRSVYMLMFGCDEEVVDAH